MRHRKDHEGCRPEGSHDTVISDEVEEAEKYHCHETCNAALDNVMTGFATELGIEVESESHLSLLPLNSSHENNQNLPVEQPHLEISLGLPKID